jgi:hypothetical protein
MAADGVDARRLDFGFGTRVFHAADGAVKADEDFAVNGLATVDADRRASAASLAMKIGRHGG